MKELSAFFPPGLEYRIVYDPTQFVQQSVDAVYHTLFEAIVLVLIVVLIFLQTWRATIIPLLAVPVSLIGTFAVMAALGFSLNNLSLFGLVLAIGIVVDDAIVVVENVERNLEEGLEPRLRRAKRWTKWAERWWPLPSSSALCLSRPRLSAGSQASSTGSLL